MKKLMLSLIGGACIVGSVFADISVGFVNDPPILDGAGGSPITGGFVSVLVWSPTAPVMSELAGLDGRANTSEFVLVRETGMSPGIFDAVTSQNGGAYFVFDGSDVGGATVNINEGYLFTRVFHTTGSDIHQGDDYLQIQVLGDGTASGLPLYTNPDGTKNVPFYTSTVLPPGTAIDSQNLQAVPEPGTFGLMGLAGLGLFMARRSALKKARRI